MKMLIKRKMVTFEQYHHSSTSSYRKPKSYSYVYESQPTYEQQIKCDYVPVQNCTVKQVQPVVLGPTAQLQLQ